MKQQGALAPHGEVRAANRFNVILGWVTRGVEAVLAVLVALLVALLFAQVVFRYAVNAPIMWAEQLARWIFVWITFLAASIVYRRGFHISIDVFVSWLPNRARQVIELANLLLIGVFLVVFGYYGYLLTMGTRSQVFGSLQLPPSFIYAAAPVASLLMSLFTIEKAIRAWRHGPAQPAPPPDVAAGTAAELAQ